MIKSSVFQFLNLHAQNIGNFGGGILAGTYQRPVVIQFVISGKFPEPEWDGVSLSGSMLMSRKEIL